MRSRTHRHSAAKLTPHVASASRGARPSAKRSLGSSTAPLAVAAVALLAACAFSPEAKAVIIGWNFSDTNATFDTGTPANFSVGNISIANSFGTVATPITTVSASSGYTGSSGTGNIGQAVNNAAFSTASSPYFTMTFTPDANFALQITDFDFGMRSTGTGATAFALYSSVDNFGAAIFTGANTANSTWTLKDNTPFTLNGLANTAVTLRLYVYGGASNAGSGTINTKLDDISITLSALTAALLGSYWDANGTAGVGGTGQWDATTANWNTAADGTGTLAAFDPSANLTFAGTAGVVTINQGATGVTHNSNLTFAATGYEIAGTGAGGTLNLGAASPVITVTNSTDTATISAVVAGTKGLTKSGNGKLVLSGTNTYTGGTTLSGGTLSVASDANLGDVSGAITFAGGTLQLTAALSTDRSIVVGTGGGTLDTNGFNTSLNGVLTGSATLTKINGGTLTLTNSSAAFAGTLAISGGALANTTGISLGGTVALNTGTFLYPAGDGGSAAGTLALSTLTLNTGSTLAFDFFAGVPDFITTTTLDNQATSPVPVNVAGTGFAIGTYDLISFTTPGGTGTYTIGSHPTDSFTYSIVQTGSKLQLRVVNQGTITDVLWDAPGGTSPDDGAGSWSDGSTNFYANGIGPVTWSNAAGYNLTFGASTTGTGGLITLAGPVRVGGALTFAPVASPYTVGTVSGTNTLTVAAGIAANESATINAPTILETSETFSVAAGKILTFNGVISGTGNKLTKTGSGTLLLNSAPTFDGGLDINGGTVKAGGINTLPAAGAITLGNVTGVVLDLGGANQVISALAGGGAAGGLVSLGTATLTVGDASSTSFDGIISGTTGSIVKQGTGTLTLTGANTFGGTTTISTGALAAGGSSAFGSSSSVTVTPGAQLQLAIAAGGTYTLGTSPVIISGTGLSSTGALVLASTVGSSSTHIITNDLSFPAAVTLGVSATNTISVAGKLTGTGDISKIAPGTLTLTGAGSTATGSLQVFEGTVTASGANALPAGPLVLTQSAGSTAQVNINESQTVGDLSSTYTGGPGLGKNVLSVAAGKTLTINQQGSTTFGAAGTVDDAGKTTTLSGAGSIALGASSTGTLNLDGANTFTGSVAVNGGELKLVSPTALNVTTPNPVSVAGTGKFTLNGNSVTTGGLSGTDATAVVQNASSTPATLTVNKASGVSIYNGTLVDGTGGGALTLAKSGSGELSIGGTNTFTGGALVTAGILRSSSNAALGPSGVNVNGGALLGAAGVTTNNVITISQGAPVTTLLAGWDFQTATTGGTTINAAPNTPQVINANLGAGTIFLNGTNGASTWNSTASNPELTGFGGTTVNAAPGMSTVTAGAAALALANSSANGKFVVFKVDMTGYTGLTISYATQRTSTGFTDQAWSFSTDATNWTPLQTLTGLLASFATQTLTQITGLANAPTAYVRLSVTGATATGGNNRLDNFQFNAEGAGVSILGSDITTGTTTFAGDVKLQTGVTLTSAAGGTVAISGKITDDTGTNSATKVGAGVVALSGANTYAGGTIVSAGTLQLAGGNVGTVGAITSSPIGTGPLTLSGGAFSSDSSTARTLLNPITLAKDSTLGDATNTGKITASAPVTITGTAGTLRQLTTASDVDITAAIGDGGTGLGLSKSGNGTLTLSAVNTYSAGTEVKLGLLIASNSQALGSGSVTLSGGNLKATSTATLANAVTFKSTTSTYQFDRPIGASYNPFTAKSSFTGGADTTATILAGTSVGTAHTVTSSFSNLPIALNDAIRVSDALSLTGTSTDPYVLQLAISSLPGIDPQVTFLAGLDTGSNTWVNAISLNTGNNATVAQQAFVGSFAAFQTANPGPISSYIGAYGLDPANNNVWAVVNYGDSFVVVPEPSTALFLAASVGALGLTRRRRK